VATLAGDPHRGVDDRTGQVVDGVVALPCVAHDDRDALAHETIGQFAHQAEEQAGIAGQDGLVSGAIRQPPEDAAGPRTGAAQEVVGGRKA